MKTLKQIREEKGVTKVAMARHLRISGPTYDIYEANPQRMRVETAKEAAEFLGVELADIFFAPNCN